MNPVLIRWRDACAKGGWTSRSDCEYTDDDVMVSTVGWLVVDKSDGIVVVQSCGNESHDEDAFINSQYIPRGMIESIKELSE